MTNDPRVLLNYWFERPVSRRALLTSAFTMALASTTIGRAIGVSTPGFNVILGRPTPNSVALSFLPSEKMTFYVQYGYSRSSYAYRTEALVATTDAPKVVELKGLRANSKVYYRIRYSIEGSKAMKAGKQFSFSTAKSKGSSFSFSVHGDTHPERAGKMFDSDLYYITMANVAEQQPDFHILMGDDFSIDPLIAKGQATQSNVEKVYRTHRNWLGVIGSSVPIFLINGNHEQAAAYLLNGSASSPAVLAGNARLKYYPLPAPDGFYSGNESAIPGVGLPRDYFAWTWGDALFVTLDPYWHSSVAVDNVAGVTVNESDSAVTMTKKGSAGKAGTGKGKDLWTIGIGDAQYAWLKKTLESSDAKFKFVFAHHVMGTGRGGVELSYDYEWGGRDPKGVTSFEKERPNWELPIHDLMVKNKVSIFFQGHDHIFVTQERDGLIYQSMPNPADDTYSYFNESAYKSGVKAPNSGHVRVTVQGEEALVEYFLASRTSDASRKNLQLAHSYKVKPGI